jgi:serine/threonine protein kinase
LDKLFERIKLGRLQFYEEYWGKISDDAKDFINKMITVDQKKRYTCQQLLQHEWLTKTDAETEKKLDGVDLSNTLGEIRRFNARRRLKAAADAIIVTNRMNKLIQSISFAAKSQASADEDEAEQSHVAADGSAASATSQVLASPERVRAS